MTCGGDSVQITPPRRRKRPQNARGGYSDDTQNGTRDNGGSARGYQGLPAPLAIPARGHPDSGEVVFFSLSHKP